jgi:hypothetical protein
MGSDFLTGKGVWKVRFKKKDIIFRLILSAIFFGVTYVILLQSADTVITMMRRDSPPASQVEGSVVKRAYGWLPVWRVNFLAPYKVYIAEGSMTDSRNSRVRKTVTQLRVLTDTGRDIGLTPSRSDVAQIRVLADTTNERELKLFPSGVANNQEIADWINAFLTDKKPGKLQFILAREKDRRAGSITAAIIFMLGLLIGPGKILSDAMVWSVQHYYAKTHKRLSKDINTRREPR